MTKEIKFYINANGYKNRFAIADENGNPVWFGRFFDSEEFCSWDRDQKFFHTHPTVYTFKKVLWLMKKYFENEDVSLTIYSGNVLGMEEVEMNDFFGSELKIKLDFCPESDDFAKKYVMGKGFQSHKDYDFKGI